jgi:hypothetical protein
VYLQDSVDDQLLLSICFASSSLWLPVCRHRQSARFNRMSRQQNLADSGTIATWAARYIDMRGRMQFSLSGSLATMANGLPYSIGAAVACPSTVRLRLVHLHANPLPRGVTGLFDV